MSSNCEDQLKELEDEDVLFDRSKCQTLESKLSKLQIAEDKLDSENETKTQLAGDDNTESKMSEEEMKEFYYQKALKAARSLYEKMKKLNPDLPDISEFEPKDENKEKLNVSISQEEKTNSKEKDVISSEESKSKSASSLEPNSYSGDVEDNKEEETNRHEYFHYFPRDSYIYKEDGKNYEVYMRRGYSGVVPKDE